MRDPAVRRGNDLVGTAPTQRDLTPLGQRVPHPGTPAKTLGRAVERLHLHRMVQPGQPVELLADHLGLEPPLCGNGSMLPVASPAAAGTGVRARRVHPVRGRPQHLDGVRPPVPGMRRVSQPGPHPLPRQRMPDEDHPPVVTRHAGPPVRDRPHLKFDHVPGPAGVPPGSAGPGRAGAHRRGTPAVPTPVPSGGVPEASRSGEATVSPIRAPTDVRPAPAGTPGAG